MDKAGKEDVSRQGRPATPRPPVIVVGAGPVGLAVTLDLVFRGVRDVVLLDEGEGPAIGSRAICWSRRTLEILTRLGVGRALIERGFTWQTGRVFLAGDELFRFDLQPEPGYGHPAFINLSQHDFEAALIEQLAAVGHPGVVWRHRVTGLTQGADHVTLAVDTPAGGTTQAAEWVIAADGPRSTLRRLLGLRCIGRVFDERFLIADVRTNADLGQERRFWFHPPFHHGHSALMHRQPDNIFRLDFQLGSDADPVEERKPERITPRLERVLGDRSHFDLVWASVYIFQCSRLERFLHGRVVFAGDSAHQVSPFGARGGNSGIQDADNLAWKLALVVAGKAPPRLLESYDAERVVACDENILHSTRATDFMSPKPGFATTLRDAVLALARSEPFARALINSGRLSVPAVLDGSPLNGPDVAEFPRLARPGAPCPDAPIAREDGKPGWLLDALGDGFVGLYRVPKGGVPADVAQAAARWRRLAVPLALLPVGETPGAIVDAEGLVAARCGGEAGSFVLIRPDQHVAARFRAFDETEIEAALARALASEVVPQESQCVA
jgi:3-(3-hydroxy-phenyl)propionate hydroxylase